MEPTAQNGPEMVQKWPQIGHKNDQSTNRPLHVLRELNRPFLTNLKLFNSHAVGLVSFGLRINFVENPIFG